MKALTKGLKEYGCTETAPKLEDDTKCTADSSTFIVEKQHPPSPPGACGRGGTPRL